MTTAISFNCSTAFFFGFFFLSLSFFFHVSLFGLVGRLIFRFHSVMDAAGCCWKLQERPVPNRSNRAISSFLRTFVVSYIRNPSHTLFKTHHLFWIQFLNLYLSNCLHFQQMNRIAGPLIIDSFPTFLNLIWLFNSIFPFELIRLLIIIINYHYIM